MIFRRKKLEHSLADSQTQILISVLIIELPPCHLSNPTEPPTCLVVERVRLADLDDFVHSGQLQHARCGGGGCREGGKCVSDGSQLHENRNRRVLRTVNLPIFSGKNKKEKDR